MKWLGILLAAAVPAVIGESIVLEDFATPKHTWTQKNDPVMGGKSTGTFSIDGGEGLFKGNVVDIPFLGAPGFIKVVSDNEKGSRVRYPDVSSCTALTITAKAKVAYAGYRVSFGTAKPPEGKFFANGYKAHFNASVGDFSTVEIPFNMFSDYWDDATGDPIKTCAENEKYCPNKEALSDLKTISVWGEGKAGEVDLEIKSIGATGCGSSVSFASFAIVTEVAPQARKFHWKASPDYNCSGPIQHNLRYNMSHTMAEEDFPFPLDEGETLAEAICCDNKFTAGYAEPRQTYARPDVSLYSRMNQDGTTTFYDSVCGIPLFIAPVNRTFEDFQADTDEHGWPSFRPGELIQGNSYTREGTNLHVSKCGTHLGTFLPDERGDRWCLDLSCLAGNPVEALVSVQ